MILPQGRGAPAARVIVAGRNVSIWTGAPKEPGRVVVRYGGSAVTQQSGGDGVAYVVSDQTDYALRLTSDSFRGFKSDRWFFAKANFASGADESVRCLAAHSY